jgi:hypothetical protein
MSIETRGAQGRDSSRSLNAGTIVRREFFVIPVPNVLPPVTPEDGKQMASSLSEQHDQDVIYRAMVDPDEPLEVRFPGLFGNFNYADVTKTSIPVGLHMVFEGPSDRDVATQLQGLMDGFTSSK